jgi:hypothetical protein
MSINHNHAFGRRHQVAEFRFDGTEGAAHAKHGLLLDYPRGEADELWIRARGETEWAEVPLRGSWFLDAFIGRMANLQRFYTGEDPSSVEDTWTTISLVEAAFESSASPATPLKAHPDGEDARQKRNDGAYSGVRRAWSLGKLIKSE